jgi:hypothetical protein
MRWSRITFFVFAFYLSASLGAAQQTTISSTQSSPQALTLLQQSLAALVGGQSITDITLSGSARRIAGSDDETGTATLKAISGDASRVDLSLPSGRRNETLNSTNTPPTGSWSGPDGVSHPIANHNLLTDSAWFFPAFGIANRLSATGFVATYVGQETHNGLPVQHVSVLQTASFTNPPGGPTFQHLTQVDFFLDSTTFLPAAIAFNIHPDNNALLDLLVEIRFSDYRVVNGAEVPFHVQKFLNNGLLLDFQAQFATLNSGLAASSFQVP